MKEECEHNFQYKETIRQEMFDKVMMCGEFRSTGKRLDDNLYAIFVCEKCNEVKNKKI